MNQNLCVNKTNFHIKGFALGLALKQGERQLGNRPISEDFTYLRGTIKNYRGIRIEILSLNSEYFFGRCVIMQISF